MRNTFFHTILALTAFFFTSCYATSFNQGSVYSFLDKQTVFVETTSIIKAVGCRGSSPEEEEKCQDMLSSLPAIFGRYTGSGTFIRRKGKIAVLTAEHVCSPVNNVPKSVLKEGLIISVSHSLKIKTRSRKFESSAKIMKKDAKLDLCILELDTQPNGFIDPARFAFEAPKRGDEVHYAGAPQGMMSEDALPMFKGMFAGTIWNSYLFSLPCSPGSSGSSIRNSDNQIVSMVQRVHRRFHHLCYGVSTKDLKDFVFK